MHRLLSDLAADGVAVLMISSELPEVLGMADRIVVLFEGRVSRAFTRAEADEDAIMRAATGLTEEALHDDHARAPPRAARRRSRERRLALARGARRSASASSGSCWRSSLVVGVTAVNNSNFVSATNLQQIVRGAAIIGLLAIGETMVIVTRNVDLSVGSVLGLSAYAAGLLFERAPGRPDPASSCSPGSASAWRAGSSTARSSRSPACRASWSRSARCT